MGSKCWGGVQDEDSRLEGEQAFWPGDGITYGAMSPATTGHNRPQSGTEIQVYTQIPMFVYDWELTRGRSLQQDGLFHWPLACQTLLEKGDGMEGLGNVLRP